MKLRKLFTVQFEYQTQVIKKEVNNSFMEVIVNNSMEIQSLNHVWSKLAYKKFKGNQSLN